MIPLTMIVMLHLFPYLVSKNPNGECNPLLGEDDVAGIILGVGVTAISLAWTGWSSTAEQKITSGTTYVYRDESLGKGVPACHV